MDMWQKLLANQVLMSAVAGWTLAQVLKTAIDWILNKNFNMERLVGSGGMPSSHSATVCGLTVAAGLRYGVGSFEFAVSFILGMIVMYDAMGVRRETGIQAHVLNEMLDIFSDMGSDMSPQDKLKEFVGHTPLQVLIGAILGIIIAIVICNVL